MEECCLAGDDIACLRGERLLFRRLSLALSSGEALHLAGPNGIGKSSLIRILAGLRRPYAGTIARTGTIGLLDERPALDEHLPLGQALHFWNRIDDSAQTHWERLGLEQLADVPVRYLSTGQRKRAALARLAGQGAPIWLLDEPLNGLDSDAVAKCEGMVAQHCASGGIAIIASHQPFSMQGLTKLMLSEYTP